MCASSCAAGCGGSIVSRRGSSAAATACALLPTKMEPPAESVTLLRCSAKSATAAASLPLVGWGTPSLGTR